MINLASVLSLQLYPIRDLQQRQFEAPVTGDRGDNETKPVLTQVLVSTSYLKLTPHRCSSWVGIGKGSLVHMCVHRGVELTSTVMYG